MGLTVTPENLVLAKEIILCAENSLNLGEFYRLSIITPATAGKSHQDRQNMFDLLLQEGAVGVVDGSLRLFPGKVPPWLERASQMGYKEAQEVAEKFLVSEEERRVFDDALLKDIGRLGEVAFVEYLQTVPGLTRVTQVSLFDDTLGYDISAELDNGDTYFFEVKTSSRYKEENFRFFLSSNEAERAFNLPNWHLVCMQLSDGSARLLGVLDWDKFASRLPINKSQDVTWNSIKANVLTQELLSLPFPI